MATINPAAQALERAITDLLLYLGEDPTREGLQATPARFVKAYQEMTRGYKQEPAQILSTVFHEAESDSMIIVRNIAFTSLCEHHLLPFIGKASVAYIPKDGRIIGLSKIPRLVHCFAKRLQVQERLTQQIGSALDEALKPLGVAVQIIAAHECLACRGLELSGSDMVTSFLSGAFYSDSIVRAEFYTQLQRA